MMKLWSPAMIEVYIEYVYPYAERMDNIVAEKRSTFDWIMRRKQESFNIFCECVRAQCKSTQQTKKICYGG